MDLIDIGIHHIVPCAITLYNSFSIDLFFVSANITVESDDMKGKIGEWIDSNINPPIYLPSNTRSITRFVPIHIDTLLSWDMIKKFYQLLIEGGTKITVKGNITAIIAGPKQSNGIKQTVFVQAIGVNSTLVS
jgi:hypothetical protein